MSKNGKIKNHADLALALCVEPSEDLEWLDKAISHRVYKETSCGAWAKLESNVPSGRQESQDWKVDIRRTVGGYVAKRARRAKGRKWYTPDQWPQELVDFVSWDKGLDECGYILNETVLDYLDKEVPWKGERPAGRSPYFDAHGLEVYKGGWVEGVSFGSIVEGVDKTTDVITVTFPCTEQDIWDALQKVEDQAEMIWKRPMDAPRAGMARRS